MVLYNIPLIQRKVIPSMLSTLDKIKLEDPVKAMVMHSMKIFIKVNNKVIKQN
jgi:hypothetical protein